MVHDIKGALLFQQHLPWNVTPHVWLQHFLKVGAILLDSVAVTKSRKCCFSLAQTFCNKFDSNRNFEICKCEKPSKYQIWQSLGETIANLLESKYKIGLVK